jgi:hypothetical protein
MTDQSPHFGKKCPINEGANRINEQPFQYHLWQTRSLIKGNLPFKSNTYGAKRAITSAPIQSKR